MSKEKVSKSETCIRTVEVRLPARWRVIIHNDEVTTMDFVVTVLVAVFNKSVPVAREIMMKVHKQGRGVAGLYTKEIAETKIFEATLLARKAGFPLLFTMEESDKE